MFETTYMESSYGLEGFVVVFCNCKLYYLEEWSFFNSTGWQLGWSPVKQAPVERHPDLCFQNLRSKQWLQPRRVKDTDTEKLYLKGCMAEPGICHILV